MDGEFYMCRLCLEQVDPAAAVVLNKEQNMIERIFQVTTVQVIVDPNHLVFMCGHCQSLLDTTHKFRLMCLQNDGKFRDLHAKHENALKTVKTEQEVAKHEDSSSSVDDCEENIGHEESLISMKDKSKTSKSELIDDDGQKSDPNWDPEVTKPSKTGKKLKTKISRKKKPFDKVKEKVPCPTCSTLMLTTSLRKHMQIHDQNRPMFTCEQCPKRFTEKRTLQDHIAIVHEGHPVHTCDRCGKTFHGREGLRQHYFGVHTDLKNYECKVCGEKFARAANRNFHYAMHHTTEKRFVCSYCGKSFKRSGQRSLHVRIHTGEKPYKCDVCNKEFARVTNWRRHKKTHQTAEMRRDLKMNAEDLEQQDTGSENVVE